MDSIFLLRYTRDTETLCHLIDEGKCNLIGRLGRLTSAQKDIPIGTYLKFSKVIFSQDIIFTNETNVTKSNEAHNMNFHFQSEEAHARDNRLKFLSGFSGSYGFAVVTSNKAAIWVTGLDELQADLELSCDWLLMKSGHPGVSVF